MNRTPRPALREAFFSGSRQLEVYFYTSNIDKFLQARIVFERVGLALHHFKSRDEPYSEDYSGTTELLLERAINEILKSVGHGSLFFVEDTSLRLAALSASNDVPGMAVKEWFAQTSFAALDLELQKLGNERSAIVKSDIGLHLPGRNRPLFFHGETRGVVADSAPAFEASPQFPWLSPNSFNGWFIPNSSGRRLGEMSFEESWAFDFRIRSLVSLLDRLEEYAAVLALPPQAYSRRRERVSPVPQLSLLPQEFPLFIVVGRTCSGKTTFAEWASVNHGLMFIEASSVVRMFEHEYASEHLDAFGLAKRLLEEKGPDVVARKLLELLGTPRQQGVVVSGFRTIEEVEVIKSHYPGARVVVIEASERIRYERHLSRNRIDEARTLQEFRALDRQQWKFGLLRIAEDFADIKILNEGSLDHYHQQVAAVLSEPKEVSFPGVSASVRPRHTRNKNQLYRTLAVLGKSDRPLTTDEIATAVLADGSPIRPNNVNKVLKAVPELARRLEMQGGRVRYEIGTAGRAYVRLAQTFS